jgi:hypothetical protein
MLQGYRRANLVWNPGSQRDVCEGYGLLARTSRAKPRWALAPEGTALEGKWQPSAAKADYLRRFDGGAKSPAPSKKAFVTERRSRTIEQLICTRLTFSRPFGTHADSFRSLFSPQLQQNLHETVGNGFGAGAKKPKFVQAPYGMTKSRARIQSKNTT